MRPDSGATGDRGSCCSNDHTPLRGEQQEQSIMIGEDVKNKFVAYCFIWNLAELHEVKT